MKESSFIDQNKEKWEESERLLSDSRKDTDKLSSLFVQLVDDLSYARTFFSYRFITVYLNQTSMKFFSKIYTRKKSKWANFTDFWKEELPQVVIHCRIELMIALAVFMLSVAVGVVSSANDPSFVSSILGKSYVEMTKENINSGDPMAVYKKGSQGDMFLGITINNIMVAFRTYLFGLLAGIGTLSSLLYNGIMLGAFQYFFYEQHLLGTSMLAIWLHGTLEISSIVIAGGAGLTLARGLILPGTLSRSQSFYISATRSLKLLIGTIPIFIMAGFVESFITRYTEIPDLIRFFFILLSLSFIVGYFVVYPYIKAKRGFKIPMAVTKLSPTRKTAVPFNTIKTNADIFQDTFFLFQKNFGRIALTLALCSLVLSTAYYLLKVTTNTTIELEQIGSWLSIVFKKLFKIYNYNNAGYVLACSVATGAVLFIINHFIINAAQDDAKHTTPYYIIAITNSVIIGCLIHFAIYATSAACVFLFVLFIPFLLLLNFIAQVRGAFFLIALGQFFKLLSGNFKQAAGLFLMLLIISVVFTLVFNSPLLYLYYEQVRININPELKYLEDILNFVSFTLSGFIILLVQAYGMINIALFYYSANEVSTARSLKQRIQMLSTPVSPYAS